jgi:hypothetical protein
MADDKTMTVEEALHRVEALKKDVEYVNGLEKKWRDQKKRFPIIYEGIKKQAEAFGIRIQQLKTRRVHTTIEELDKLRHAAASGEALNGVFHEAVDAVEEAARSND